MREVCYNTHTYHTNKHPNNYPKRFSIIYSVFILGLFFFCPQLNEKKTVAPKPTHPPLSLSLFILQKQQHNKFNVFKIDDTLIKNQAMQSGFVWSCQIFHLTCEWFVLRWSSLLFQVNSRSFKFYLISIE